MEFNECKFNMFVSWIVKTYMTGVPQTSPEHPIIWSPERPATGSRRHTIDVPIYNFWIFFFPVKNSNRCVKQRLLHLKNTFFTKSSIFLLVLYKSPEGSLEVPDIRTFRGPSRNVPGTSRAGWVYLSRSGFEIQNQQPEVFFKKSCS